MGQAFATATDGKRGYKVYSRGKGEGTDHMDLIAASTSNSKSTEDDFIFGAHAGFVGNVDGWHRPDVLLGYVWHQSEERLSTPNRTSFFLPLGETDVSVRRA